MNFYEMIGLFSTNLWIYGGTFVLVLSLLIFIHEWGHYIVARLCGIKVETFSIGFGKEIIGRNDSHGTRWKLCWVPLGGYVKLFGDVDPASIKHSDEIKDENAERPRPMTAAERDMAFFAKPVWKRAAVVVAGPAINYIFAIAVLTLLFIFSGQPVTPPVAGGIVADSSAARHGFKPNDRIVSIDGKSIYDFDDIRRQMMISLDTPKNFVIDRDGKRMEIEARPDKIDMQDRFGFRHSQGMLGLISPAHAIDIKNISKIDGIAYTNPVKIHLALKKKLGRDIKIEMNGEENSTSLTVHPLKENNASLGSETDADYNLLFLNNSKGRNEFVKYNPVEAVGQALHETWVVTQGTLESLGQIVVGTRSATELGGVIRIGALAGDMAKQGFIAFILFAALLSINLGLINLFPIPLLDGGHLLFYAFESVLGRPIPERIQEYAFRFGLAFLVGIMVFANLNDIMQIIFQET